MVSINYSAREVCCKIVYYGPGLSGKTTNLQYVHEKVPGNTRGDLISLATEADRTLYFDFLPINIGTINGFAAKFQLYTVPGQVYYNATRKLVLRGVDGIVFVADSQPDKMDENIESLANLEENLREYGYDINDIPLVLQYNKRDLPGVLPVEQLNAQLNPRGVPFFEASATQGKGVFDTLKLIIRLVLDKAKNSNKNQRKPVTAASLAQGAGTSPPVSPSAQPVPATPGASTPPPTPSTPPAAAATSPTPPVTPVTPPPQQSQPQEPQPVPVAASATSQPQTPSPAGTAGNTQAGVVPQTIQPDTKPQPAQPVVPEPKQEQYRPYPGGSTGKIKQPGASQVKPVTPVPKAASVQQAPQSISNDNTIPQQQQDSDHVPIMAPSLRRRAEKKKRGFFKRLFGIK